VRSDGHQGRDPPAEQTSLMTCLFREFNIYPTSHNKKEKANYAMVSTNSLGTSGSHYC
jgi:hypothetical protein